MKRLRKKGEQEKKVGGKEKEKEDETVTVDCDGRLLTAS